MKNLIKALGIAGITALSFFPMKDYAQSDDYIKEESDKGFASLVTGMELSVCENFAWAYFDSSAHILNGSSSKEKLIEKVKLSLDYLGLSESALNLFIEKSRDYQPYENKDLPFTMSTKTKLDTNEIKKFIPYFKELREKEEYFLKNPEEMNLQIFLDNLTKKYEKTYAVINFSLE